MNWIYNLSDSYDRFTQSTGVMLFEIIFSLILMIVFITLMWVSSKSKLPAENDPDGNQQIKRKFYDIM